MHLGGERILQSPFCPHNDDDTTQHRQIDDKQHHRALAWSEQDVVKIMAMQNVRPAMHDAARLVLHEPSSS